MNEQLSGYYLGKILVTGIVTNIWKTLNRNTAYRLKLLNPQNMFGYIHDEVILYEEDLLAENK